MSQIAAHFKQSKYLCYFSFSDSPFKFKFALLCAGFKSKSTQHQKYYANTIHCPSLHIFGESDKVIAGGMLVSYFCVTLQLNTSQCASWYEIIGMFCMFLYKELMALNAKIE